ncbi:MAG: hypothetical protein A3H34_05930 [Betaproteobacteria bacterium RIFCSPLOWO2_02_FULL_67_19]|nr:MAG: hypothetical protein A3H34_05930 [Betaproteobacteria bacterium RIFCSPLOWO2_02_FULL_67_19]
MYQQTVEIAIDTETDQRIAASELLTLPEADFSAMRRLAMAERVARKNGANRARYICAICRIPLWLSRYNHDEGNRWFKHDEASTGCPWFEGNKLSPVQRRALIYRGQQEGAEHRRVKEFIASWLEKEPGVTKVDRELVTHGQILKGEWKRPDVQCVKDGKRIVFEIQLSYTFLSEVIKRDEFYRREGIFIIWVFSFFDLRRATVRDEAFFNQRNLFVLDATAFAETAKRSLLTFNGHFQNPVFNGNAIEDEWTTRPITLQEAQFPTSTYRPFFFDYDAARRALERERAQSERQAMQAKREAQETSVQRWRDEQRTSFRLGVREYLRTAIAYCDSDYSDELKQRLIDAAAELKDNHHWHRGLAPLSDEKFFGWHRVLPVLLSMKHGRVLGYRLDSAYQVLEAGVRQSTQRRVYGFAVVYLWASDIYKVPLNEKQRQWRKALARKVKLSVDGDEATYRRATYYDEAIVLLFPELEEKLSSGFAA